MADLSVAHRVALAQVVESVPDRALAQLAVVAAGLPGERARALEALVNAEVVDRDRRARALGPLAPMFRSRSDGVASLHFPPAVLSRLWKIAADRETALLPLLDDLDARGSAEALVVCGRVCVAAAAVVRDQPDCVWPLGQGDPEAREAALSELAKCCDLGPLVHRALPSLKAWIGRPDDDALAELRLLVRDCAEVAPDGARRLLDILFAHLADAALLPRLAAHASPAAGRETFLADSELAVFIDRLIDAVEFRAARVAAFEFSRLGASTEARNQFRLDVAWIADVLAELDTTIQPRPTGVWGGRARQARQRVNRALAALFGAAPKAVERLLPMARVQTVGRMTRQTPCLDAVPDPVALEAARDILSLLSAVRGAAGTFGCEGQRRQLIEEITERLAGFAALALEAVNSGDAPDEAVALNLIEMCADLLERIEAAGEARTVRRRAAVAGAPPRAQETSPEAA